MGKHRQLLKSALYLAVLSCVFGSIRAGYARERERVTLVEPAAASQVFDTHISGANLDASSSDAVDDGHGSA